MSVAGFTDSVGVLMVAKELTDNGLDACTRVDVQKYGFQSRPCVDIELRGDYGSPVNICCRDSVSLLPLPCMGTALQEGRRE